MTKFYKSIALAFALCFSAVGVSACSTIGNAIGNEDAAVYDEKAQITVELAYSFVLTSVISANNAGAITPAQARELAPQLEQAQASVLRARALYDAGNAVDASFATQDAVAKVAAITNLLVTLGVISPN